MTVVICILQCAQNARTGRIDTQWLKWRNYSTDGKMPTSQISSPKAESTWSKWSAFVTTQVIFYHQYHHYMYHSLVPFHCIHLNLQILSPFIIFIFIFPRPPITFDQKLHIIQYIPIAELRRPHHKKIKFCKGQNDFQIETRFHSSCPLTGFFHMFIHK